MPHLSRYDTRSLQENCLSFKMIMKKKKKELRWVLYDVIRSSIIRWLSVHPFESSHGHNKRRYKKEI
jgi:hypothetical protein